VVLLTLLALMSGTVAGQERNAQRPRRQVPKGVRALLDVAYMPGPKIHPLQKLDLFIPDDPIEPSRGPKPLIVYIHGGAWRGGDKRDFPAMAFTAKGYGVASVNYRLSQEAPFPAQVEDCKAAVRFLRKNAKAFGLDPDRIGAWGDSAGGHLVALLGTAADEKEWDAGDEKISSRVQCVVDWFGPTDLAKMNAQASKPSQIDHDAPDSPESRLVGGPIQQNQEKAAKASPITYVTADDPPFLIMHGDQDPLVPITQSQTFADALKAAGVEVTFEILPGAGHGGAAFMAPESMRKLEMFFDEHLKRAKESPKADPPQAPAPKALAPKAAPAGA
jgi:acetyl esterase/lipase